MTGTRIRKVEGMEIHHIDLNPGNNVVSNLFQTARHRSLHNGLEALFQEWELKARGSPSYHNLIEYFLHTGELVFDREVPEYRFVIIPGGKLEEYQKTLNSIGMFPRCKVDCFADAKNYVRILRPAREELEVSALEWRVFQK